MWKIEHRAYRLPFRTVVRTAHGPWAVREGFLLRAVRLEANGAEIGTAGWGEVAPIPWFGTETVDEAEAALAGLNGESANLDEALARVPVECGCARAGLAAAMGRGDADGVVNHETHERHETQSSEVTVKFLPVAGLLPGGRAALAAVAARLELGFRTFKWKVGVGAAADEWAILDDLIGELPAGAKLRLDANGAWDRKVAEGWLARASERPMIEYVEQPCFADRRKGVERVRKNEDLLRGLAEDFPVKIALATQMDRMFTRFERSARRRLVRCCGMMRMAPGPVSSVTAGWRRIGAACGSSSRRCSATRSGCSRS